MSREDTPLIQFFNVDGEPCYYLNETGRHDGSGLKDDGSGSAEGASGKVRWPVGEKELTKTVYVNDGGEDEYFHRWGCKNQDRKTNRSMTVHKAKEHRKLPCPECCGEMYGN